MMASMVSMYDGEHVKTEMKAAEILNSFFSNKVKNIKVLQYSNFDQNYIMQNAKYKLQSTNYRKSKLKDTHRKKAPSNKTPALTNSTNMGIWVVGTSYQLFIRGS